MIAFRHSPSTGPRLFRRDPPIDPPREHVERQRAVVDQRVVKAPDVETGAERLLRFRAQRLDRELADLVAERLSRLDDVAVDLRGRERFVDAAVVIGKDFPALKPMK